MYLMPTAHNPLGITIAMEKRRQLAELARECQVPIIEDDAYSALFYDADPMPPIRAIEQDWVYYVGSLSKLLGPSLRIGWIIAPPEHIQALSIIKEASDLNVSTLSHWVANEYLEKEDILSHVSGLIEAYRERRNAMDAALINHMPSSAQWQVPNCGVFFWEELPHSVDTSRLLKICLEEERVAFLPGEGCSRGKRKNGMRLNFSRCNPEQITEAVARIGRVLVRSGL
jgi:2-aminoadipate transaminase